MKRTDIHTFKSPIIGFHYIPYRIYQGDFKIVDTYTPDCRPAVVVEDGFHSWGSEMTAIWYALYSGLTKDLIIECIIPKGSLYYKGKNGDLVSNQIYIKDVFKGN